MTSSDSVYDEFSEDYSPKDATSNVEPLKTKKEYEAIESEKGINSIILRYGKNKTQSLNYSGLSGLPIYSNSAKCLSLILAERTVIHLEGKNLNIDEFQKKYQRAMISAINQFDAEIHDKPTDENAMIIEKITFDGNILEELKKLEEKVELLEKENENLKKQLKAS